MTAQPTAPAACVVRSDGISVVGLKYLEYRGQDAQGRAHWRTKVRTYEGDRVVLIGADASTLVIEVPS